VPGDWLERELVRVRDRVHGLAGELAALRLVDAATRAELERVARESAELETRLGALRVIVEGMSQKDEIADAVADRLQGARFTRLQTWGIRAAIAGALGGGVAELARLIAGWAQHG
jgi:hypothetical protein